MFVDGRYTEQAKSQADRSVFQLRHVVDEPPVDWISQNMGPGEKLGYDPRLHTPDAVSRFSAACRKAGAELVALPANPIDAIWRDRPQPPLGMVSQQRGRFAGESAAAKIERAREALKGADGLLISDPHNLAWLFNIRGADVAHTPLPLGFAYLPRAGRPTIFLDARKLTPAVSDELGQLAELREPDALVGFVEQLGKLGSRVSFDASTAPALLTQTLERAGGKAEVGADPVTLMKAAKNKAELAGARAAHERDGAALARFLAWFDAEASQGRLTEIDAVKALESYRRATGALRDISFPTIAGAGPNSALPHYRVSEFFKSQNRARDLPCRQRRAIRRRDDGRHPHDRGWPADEPHARSLHPGSQRAYRDRAGCVSQRNDRCADRCTGEIAALAGRAGFRPWRGAWGRLLSFRPRRAAPHRENRDDGAGSGDDSVERAGLLRIGRLRDPNRKPCRRRTASHPRRRTRDAGLRNPDACADRSQAGRSEADGRRRNQVARLRIMRGCARSCRPWWTRRRGAGWPARRGASNSTRGSR